MMKSLRRFLSPAFFTSGACLTLQAQITGDLRGEFYSIFNQHAFQTTATSSTSLATITSPTFGQYTSVSQNSRSGQPGARIVF